MNDLRDTERRLSDLLHDTTPEPPASIDLHALARTAMTPSHRTSRDVVRRLAAPLVAAAAVIGAIAGGLAIVVGGGTAVPGSSSVDEASMAQARQALAHWEAAVRANPAVGVLPTTQVIGQWEPAFLKRHAEAIASGAVKPGAKLDQKIQPPGKLVWADGEERPTMVLTANATYEQFPMPVATCAACEPLEVTGARRTSMTIQTARGPVGVPAWRFSLRDTEVELVRSAIPPPTVTPLPQKPSQSHVWYRLDAAKVGADGRTVTVEFSGAVGPRSQPCGADYTAQAVESGEAVVIIVVADVHRGDGACPTVAKQRTVTVDLPKPLAGRVIVQLAEGVPVPFSPGG
ncbi:hypothetical protein OG394_15240 [Kribbella sp. NBC_01245]|uniref:hypothetical protein n=1 Tax=Kribbella sp. NBC_01245 TaxID=2903578 RepID=UPI002E2E7928|nr:hypothetical protein [Kribbella sp. NBC_01245]